ncbi:hypothetical protein WR25_18271 [Diploscapter pachys]|uniref:Methyltransferase type 12 domain-containing protein n=1 Tax=Diploscapter pachys TaxID=2018661 RepID=A0A2A2LMK6_9BILA|nr:hypothetical protein WR25_18271 [Diploscapter pachys]
MWCINRSLSLVPVYFPPSNSPISVSVFTAIRFLTSKMLSASAAERNKGPIAEILKLYLRDGMKVLEIASGTGQHVSHFAPLFPGTTFLPSEKDARSIHSIVGYLDHFRHSNVRVPLFVDVSKPVSNWALPEDYAPNSVDVVLSINMIHISSDAAVIGLFEAANALLKRSNGLLITYGAYKFDGHISPQSNADFDESLRSKNPEWGLRDVTFLESLAQRNMLRLKAKHEMPANNHMLIFSR